MHMKKDKLSPGGLSLNEILTVLQQKKKGVLTKADVAWGKEQLSKRKSQDKRTMFSIAAIVLFILSVVFNHYQISLLHIGALILFCVFLIELTKGLLPISTASLSSTAKIVLGLVHAGLFVYYVYFFFQLLSYWNGELGSWLYAPNSPSDISILLGTVFPAAVYAIIRKPLSSK